MPETLRVKLAGKSKFHDVKNTVLTHYEVELKKLTPRDSIKRKAIMRQLKMWNRQFWINEYYTDENGEVKPQSKVIMDALAERERLEPKENSRTQTEGWVQNGPYDCDKGIGRIDRLAFHPTNPDIIFAGSPHGGLFKSNNGGNNWEPISEYVASLGVAGIAVHPTNANIIYTVSGDGDSSDGSLVDDYNYRSASNGVYKTINGGVSWKKVTEFPKLKDSIYQGRKLLIDNVNPNRIIAATSKGLFISNNSGLSWDSLYFNKNIWDICFKPNDNNILYLIQDSVFRKINVSNLLEIDSFNVIGANRISIGTTPANPSKVVLACGPKFTSKVFSSSDAGDTFNIVYQDTFLYISLIGQPALSDQTDYDNCITIDPANENTIYVGGLCVWKSTDGGVNWNQISAYRSSDSPYMHPDIHFLGFNPLNNKLYSGNDGGVYTLSNSGEWLSNFQGLTTTQFYHFEEENDEDDTWGGTQDNGILEREDGNTFVEYDEGDGYDVMTDHPSRCSGGNAENVFWTVNESIFTDCGIGQFCDISVTNNKNYFGNLAMHPEDEDKIYVGYQTTTYKSDDAGDDWLPISIDSIPGNWSICAGKNHLERIYVSGYNNKNGFKRIWRYDNGSPTDLTEGIKIKGYKTNQKITDIEINRDNDDIVYITCAGMNDSSKVYMSMDAGASWTNISFNLPNIPVFCILRDSFDGLYIGTSIGVYYKHALNNFWEPFYNGLPAVPVTQLVFEEEGSIFVHCSTFGRGLWRTLKYSQNECQTNLTLSGDPQGINYWEASNNIYSTQNIIGPGTKITYSAGKKIILTNGMKVESGAKFHGVTQPCGSEIENH